MVAIPSPDIDSSPRSKPCLAAVETPKGKLLDRCELRLRKCIGQQMWFYLFSVLCVSCDLMLLSGVHCGHPNASLEVI